VPSGAVGFYGRSKSTSVPRPLRVTVAGCKVLGDLDLLLKVNLIHSHVHEHGGEIPTIPPRA
jgi:hypothetical protein